MATGCIAQVTFKGDGFEKSVVAPFDVPYARSDGGAVLLKAIGTHLGLTTRVAACLDDPRQPGNIQQAFLAAMRAAVPASVPCVELDVHIKDPVFYDAALRVFDDWVARGLVPPGCP